MCMQPYWVKKLMSVISDQLIVQESVSWRRLQFIFTNQSPRTRPVPSNQNISFCLLTNQSFSLLAELPVTEHVCKTCKQCFVCCHAAASQSASSLRPVGQSVTCDVTNQSHDQERPLFLYGRQLVWRTAQDAAAVPRWVPLPEPSRKTCGSEPGPGTGPGLGQIIQVWPGASTSNQDLVTFCYII